MISSEGSPQTTPQIQIQQIADHTVRIQIDPQGRFPASGLNRYGFIREAEAGRQKLIPDENEGATLKTPEMTVAWSGGSACLTVDTADGKRLVTMTDCGFSEKGSWTIFDARADEDWVGFGDQTRERLYHRGHTADCHVRNVRSYIPVPFFMSTAGYGILVNTTHRIVFDLCKRTPDTFQWRDGRQVIDFYVFAGESFADLLDAYTELTGRPKLPPLWSFGLWYICRTQANDREVVDDAINFRREGIPCDVIGLEPGWMAKNYDSSVNKAWHPDRFPIPPYAWKGPHNFFNAVQRLGYHMELWLCCDYDLSGQAEARIGGGAAQEHKEDDAFYHPEGEEDPHFSRPRYLDRDTVRGQPWFEHLKPFVDQCADFFKQDGAYQVLDHPDRLWANGMADAEMHNLYPLLYARQMVEGFEAHTGRRGLSFTPCGWVGFQAWAGTWTGDTGGGSGTLGAMLNTALVGHSWATNDMEVTQKEALHVGYLLPWAQINSWNYFRMPWLQGDELLASHKAYSTFRARLIPYLYSWGWHATQTGYPLIAPLALAFPDDKDCREILLQYMLGRDLMVCGFEENVTFPAGNWRDMWTGEVISGPEQKQISWPSERGGGLFMRQGAIIPFGPLMQYRGEKPLDHIELHCFPGAADSEFVLYEDDGTSLDYQKGARAFTRVTLSTTAQSNIVRIAPRDGSFDGMCRNRTWSVVIATPDAPDTVQVDGEDLEADEWHYDPQRSECIIRVAREAAEVVTKRSVS